MATDVRCRTPPVAEHCRPGYTLGTVLAAVAAFAAVAAEVVAVDAEIHRVDFQGIDIVARCVGRRRPDPRRVAYTFPAGRAYRRCRVRRREVVFLSGPPTIAKYTPNFFTILVSIIN